MVFLFLICFLNMTNKRNINFQIIGHCFVIFMYFLMFYTNGLNKSNRSKDGKKNKQGHCLGFYSICTNRTRSEDPK